MTKLEIGAPAPLFTLADLGGQPVSLEGLRGQWVLVNFCSAECPWAERTDRVLRTLQDRLALLSIASNANEAPELLARVARERGLRTVPSDSDHAVADGYGAETTPHCYLVDPAGVLRYQ